ncbi:A/G-specific adenine glycosylase [Thermodesulfobacteriota bacterium]
MVKKNKQQKKTLSTPTISPDEAEAFQNRVLGYYRAHGRRLPWRQTRDGYSILVSEIMLQQTQVDRVIPKYSAFINAFPDVSALAGAQQKEVLALWQGLGYNRRAMALHKCALEIGEHFKGRVPRTMDELICLPGIGPYTAAAVCVFAYNQAHVILETNIRSVYIHTFYPDREAVTDDALIPLVKTTLYRKNPRRWYNALMDYGVLLKKLYGNPGRKSAHHSRQSPFKGSDREIRGQIIRELVAASTMTEDLLLSTTGKEPVRVRRILTQLLDEGFIAMRGNRYKLV